MHELFAFLFPVIAENETRVIHILTPKTGIPFGTYPIYEFYCTEKDCDCRQVYLRVLNFETGQVEADISFGWEPLSFYIQWNYGKNEDHLKDFKGPALTLLAQQGRYSKQWLKHVSEMLATDIAYAKRLEKHYDMVKKKILAK